MNIYIVYWIYRSCHTNILEEGYIGVTDNIKRRMKEHKNQKQNPHLERAFNKYDDMIIDIITLNFSEEYCYYIEYLLRPNEKIGYNIAIGGGKPPSAKGREPWIKGKHQSEETRKKQSDAIKGEKHPNYGKHHSEETRQKQSISAKARGYDINKMKKMQLASMDKIVKTYKIITPVGEEMIIINLRKYCKEKELHPSNVLRKNGSKGYKATKMLEGK